MESIQEAVIRIADCLERIEKMLPGGNQEAFREDVKKAITDLLTSERTPVEYK